jgi:hypothetical protein
MTNKMMIALSMAVFVAAVGSAQEKPQGASLQESLVKYKAESAEYTDRMNQLVVHLKRMDADIEDSISKTVEFMKRYKDSADTNERILENKEDIIKNMKKSVEKYSDLRKDMVREITMDRNYVKEDMVKIRDWADGKVKLRVKQITEIATSLGEYTVSTGGGGDGYFDDDGRDEEERLADATTEVKKDLVDDMRKGIKTLSERSEKLEKELANLRAKRPLEEINTDLIAVNEKIELLENSIDDIFSKRSTAKQTGEDGSKEIEDEMRSRVRKIKSSSTSFFKSFNSMMRMLRKQKTLNIDIEKYEFAIEQLNAGS